MTNKEVDKLWNEQGKLDKVKNIVLIIADSVGTANIREAGVLTNYLEKNLEVDSAFPTMTSTNMASLSHVQYPATHGLVGYNIYHEKIDAIFNALNCQTVRNGKDVPLSQLNINKQDIIAGDNIFAMMNKQAQICMQELCYEIWLPDLFDMTGLPNYLFGEDTPASMYSTYDPKNMLQKLYHHIFNSRSLNIITIYVPHPDVASHQYTAQSKEYFCQ